MMDNDISSMYPHTMTGKPVKPYILLESSPDSEGVMWYGLGVQVASLERWIMSQPEELWCEGSNFDGFKKGTVFFQYLVHESLYTYIALKW